MDSLLSNILYLIAIINPIRKVSVLSVLLKDADARTFRKISTRASGVALGLLIVFAAVGNFLLTTVFRVEPYSLQVVGGIVLFVIGFRALSKGIFFEEQKTKLLEMSVVPLASPLIAGPAAMTAVLSFSVEDGFPGTVVAIVIALGVNHMVMFFARPIGKVLIRYNIMGALIRITGLMIATIASQMIFAGLSGWLATVKAGGQ